MHRTSTRFARLLIGLTLLSSATTCPAQAPAMSAHSLLALLNLDRAAHHLSPLHWSDALAVAALQHARYAAQFPTLEHQYPAEPDLLTRAAHAGAHVSVVAENLFRGNPATLKVIEQTWLTTPIHRANLLNLALDSAGIALLRLPSGDLLVVEDLGRSATPIGLPQTDQALLQALSPFGLNDIRLSPAAHALCLQNNPSATASPPATVVQWDGPDPTTLPTALLDLLHRHTFHQAELATCPGQASAQGFSTTRVALLLR